MLATLCAVLLSTLFAQDAPPSTGYAVGPEDSFDIARAPAPLFRDPIFDGAADPSVVYNDDGTWWIFYTQRRANVVSPGVAWVYGCKIAVAKSTDNGRTWSYAGTAKGLESPNGPSDLATFWAPHAFRDGDTWHLFVTYIEHIDAKWGGRPTLHHYTSDDGMNWTFADEPDVGSDNFIDAAVARLPEGDEHGKWLLVFRDDNAGTKTAMCVSDDLTTWKRLPQITGDRAHEGPVVFNWKGTYWMLVDDWQGLGVYESEDGLSYERNGTILAEPGRRKEDGVKGGHAGVALAGDRAFVFYFVHPDRRDGEPMWITDNTMTIQNQRTSLQVAELELVDGKLVCDRDKYAE